MSIPERLEAGDLVLRAPLEADVSALVTACGDVEIARWTHVPHPYGPDDARTWIEKADAGRAAGNAAVFLITDDADTVLGAVGLHGVGPGLVAELGYWLTADARGRGIGTTAASALVEWAMSIGMCRIEARVLVGNESSCRLLTRIGFVEEGVLRSLPADGCGVGLERVDMHVFSRITSDR